jgi:hypothetical protein
MRFEETSDPMISDFFIWQNDLQERAIAAVAIDAQKRSGRGTFPMLTFEEGFLIRQRNRF